MSVRDEWGESSKEACEFEHYNRKVIEIKLSKRCFSSTARIIMT